MHQRSPRRRSGIISNRAAHKTGIGSTSTRRHPRDENRWLTELISASFGVASVLLVSRWDFSTATETWGISMFITVLAIICLNVTVPGTCLTEPVVNSNQEQLTMGGCLGLLGFESAKEFWEHHPLYHSWKFKGWACQFGNRAPPEHGKA